MPSGNHTYEITIINQKSEMLQIREVLPQSLVDEYRLKLNKLALTVIVAYMASKREPGSAVSKITDVTEFEFQFVIVESNV